MDFDKSSIERLKRTLYSRNEDLVPKEKRTPVAPHENDAPTNWGSAPSFELQPELMSKKSNSFFNKFLIGSLVFLLVSLSIALFIFFGGINMISSNNLEINVTAPSSVSSGDELSVGLTIINANRTDIEEASLFIEYPEGSQKVGDDKALTREKITIGTIKKGQSYDNSIRVTLFGEKDSVKKFTFSLEYRVKGSNAVFSKETNYEVIIGSSPIILNLSYPKEVNSGQQMTISIDITSNSSVPMKNVIVKAEYPYGFTFKESNIKPIRNNSVWNIGDLKDGDKKNIVITGSMLGQNLEDRTFTFSAGTESSDTTKDFNTPLVVDIATIGIRKSFFDLSVSSRNDSVRVGDTVPLTIKWTNTLSDKIVDNRIEAKISGNIFDRNKVSVSNGGFYQSLNDTVVWDKNSNDSLLSILPGASGDVSLSVNTLTNQALIRSIKNPYINVKVTMVGNRSGIDTGEIKSEEEITIKIASELSLSSKSYRNIGPLNNVGPIPPKADRESTYTITWLLTNTTNNLKDAIVYATLPVGVTWKAESSLITEKVNFNPDTRIISWEVGPIGAGVGFAYSPKTVSFKVGITPSINQIGTAPTLIEQTYVEAMDTYTENLIKSSAGIVNTKFSDPSFVSGNDSVVK